MKAAYKNILTIFLSVLLFSKLLLLSGCSSGGDDPSPSRQDEVRSVLTSGTWKIQLVMVDGVDKTSIYEELTLEFSSSSYTATNGMPVWPPNGTWSFTNDQATAFIRGDGVEVEILEATNSSLKLGLTWNDTTLGGGRISSVSGDHVFSFVR